MITNDTIDLTPRTDFEGPLLEFDFSSMLIGVAEYIEGPTGCTVFYFPGGANSVIDVRGGIPGTIMGSDGLVHAICFAGGTLYGLEAAAGVTAELFALRGYATSREAISIVRGAIIYDFRPRPNAIYPDKALGRAATRTARPGIFPLGPRGAGCSATVGKGLGLFQGENHSEPAGQGGAFRHVGPTKVAVFTVVNAFGAIINRQGQVVRGHLDPQTGARYHIADDLERRLASTESAEPAPENTTVTLLVTNQKLEPRTLQQVARQVHSSMARAIQPWHTLNDGDVLFAVTTNEVEDPALGPIALGVLASELAWDAVLSCIS